MPFYIAAPCIDVMDRSCVEECPVDCIYQGDRKLYINPLECIDCGACEPACPVEAIAGDMSPRDERLVHKEDNALFFSTPWPAGRSRWARRAGRCASGPSAWTPSAWPRTRVGPRRRAEHGPRAAGPRSAGVGDPTAVASYIEYL